MGVGNSRGGHAAGCACFSRSRRSRSRCQMRTLSRSSGKPLPLQLADVGVARQPGEMLPQIHRGVIVRNLADDRSEHLRTFTAVEHDRRHAERLVHRNRLVVLALHGVPCRRVGKRLLQELRLDAGLAKRCFDHRMIIEREAALMPRIAERLVERTDGGVAVCRADRDGGAERRRGPGVRSRPPLVTTVDDGQRKHAPIDFHHAEFIETSRPAGRLIAPRAERVEIEANALSHRHIPQM